MTVARFNYIRPVVEHTHTHTVISGIIYGGAQLEPANEYGQLWKSVKSVLESGRGAAACIVYERKKGGGASLCALQYTRRTTTRVEILI